MNKLIKFIRKENSFVTAYKKYSNDNPEVELSKRTKKRLEMYFRTYS